MTEMRKIDPRTEKCLTLIVLGNAVFIVLYMFFEGKGFSGIKEWIFPTGIAAFLLLMLAIRFVIKAFCSRPSA